MGIFLSNEELKRKLEAGEITEEEFSEDPELWLTEPIYDPEPFDKP